MFLHWKKKPEFIKLLVQAKFFNGETEFSSTEIPYLEAWIKDRGVVKMSTLFEKYILQWKAESSAKYQQSPLRSLFTKLK